MPEHVDGGQCGCWGCVQAVETRRRVLDSVELLTRRHQVIAGPELEYRVGWEEPLLVQLEQAKVPSGEGGGSSGTAGSPCDLGAVDLEAQFASELGVLTGAADRSAGQRLVERVPAAVSLAGDDLVLLELLGQCLREWVVRIKDLLEPQRRTPVDMQCPQCAAVEASSVDEVDGVVHAAAMVAVWSGERIDHITCCACGALWMREQFVALALSARPDLLQALSSAEMPR